MKIINKVEDRIDKVLAVELKQKKLSRSYLQKLIRNGNILVNTKKVNNKYILKIDDIITIDIPQAETIDLRPSDIKFEIIYEDDDIIIVDKPNDLVVHPSITQKNNTLVNGLLKKVKNLSDINGIIRPGIVHRIDKKTTGLLMVAKNNEAHQFLSKQLEEKQIHRSYIALVYGTFSNKSGTINAPIGRDNSDRKKMAITSKNSKKAITHFEIIKNYQNMTLVKCKLETGRTHQIRVHMNYINHPIYGDNTYGRLSDKNNPFGQFLHAYKLELTHPKTKKLMTFNSPLPKKFSDKLKELEREK